MGLVDLLTVAGGLWGAATLAFVALVVYLGTRDEPTDDLAEVVHLDFYRDYEEGAA